MTYHYSLTVEKTKAITLNAVCSVALNHYQFIYRQRTLEDEKFVSESKTLI